ncbi:MAG: metallophosphoesterase [Clostridia bacterium]|nr:metallophosphoesterase [Clostridia bacterium]
MFHVEKQILKLRGIKNTYTFFHISDAHIVYARDTDDEADKQLAAEHTDKWNIADIPPIEAFYQALALVKAQRNDGLFITGDCVDYIHPSCIEHLKETLTATGLELFYVYGNHEGGSYVETVPDTHVYYPYYKSLMRGTPACWVKDYGEMLIVGIDDSDREITHEQYDFLESQIARNLPIILLLHIPLYTESLAPSVREKWGRDGVQYFTLGSENDTPLTQAFCKRIQAADSNVQAVFAGHTHVSHTGEFAEGRLQFVAAPTFEKYIRKTVIEPLTER